MCVKNFSFGYVGVFHPIIYYIPVSIGALVIGILDINNGQKTAAMVLEAVLSIVPAHAVTLAYIKILYRAKFYLDDGVPNIDPWSYSGCRI
jgi:hypothetical protein